jgi:hypothetical protein
MKKINLIKRSRSALAIAFNATAASLGSNRLGGAK